MRCRHCCCSMEEYWQPIPHNIGDLLGRHNGLVEHDRGGEWLTRTAGKKPSGMQEVPERGDRASLSPDSYPELSVVVSQPPACATLITRSTFESASSPETWNRWRRVAFSLVACHARRGHQWEWHFPRGGSATSNEHTTSQDRTAEEASGMTGRQLFFSGGPSCRHASRGRK